MCDLSTIISTIIAAILATLIVALTLATLFGAFLVWPALLDCAGLETLNARGSCYRDVLLPR